MFSQGQNKSRVKRTLNWRNLIGYLWTNHITFSVTPFWICQEWNSICFFKAIFTMLGKLVHNKITIKVGLVIKWISTLLEMSKDWMEMYYKWHFYANTVPIMINVTWVMAFKWYGACFPALDRRSRVRTLLNYFVFYVSNFFWILVF